MTGIVRSVIIKILQEEVSVIDVRLIKQKHVSLAIVLNLLLALLKRSRLKIVV